MLPAYQVLGISEAATDREIKLAFKAKIRSAHPDRHGGSDAAHEHFLKIKAAYEILSDPVRRAQYHRDPEGKLESQVYIEKRLAQRKRRRQRLKKLYDD